jgi:hypothetical protein
MGFSRFKSLQSKGGHFDSITFYEFIGRNHTNLQKSNNQRVEASVNSSASFLGWVPAASPWVFDEEMIK